MVARNLLHTARTGAVHSSLPFSLVPLSVPSALCAVLYTVPSLGSKGCTPDSDGYYYVNLELWNLDDKAVPTTRSANCSNDQVGWSQLVMFASFNRTVGYSASR